MKLTRTVSGAINEELERMKELREKIRIAREERNVPSREGICKASAAREANFTRLSITCDRLISHLEKIDNPSYTIEKTDAVELVRKVCDVKESVPVMLGSLSSDSLKHFTGLTAAVAEISTATSRLVKQWQV
jgi:hypothetical protein